MSTGFGLPLMAAPAGCDGMEFIPWARQNGMPANFVNTVFVDKDDNVWFGTQSGRFQLANHMEVNAPLKLPG